MPLLKKSNKLMKRITFCVLLIKTTVDPSGIVKACACAKIMKGQNTLFWRYEHSYITTPQLRFPRSQQEFLYVTIVLYIKNTSLILMYILDFKHL